MIKYQGIGAVVITAKNAGAEVGAVCKYTESDTVTAAAAGESFQGVCVNENADLASVQVKGFVTLPYTGTAPAVGYGYLVSDGNGGVQTGSAGQQYLIAAVDTTETTVTFCM